MARDIIAKNDATCSFYQYNGFSKHICISINDQIIHGIPNDYQIKENDLITFDVGVTYNNHVCDAAFTINMNPDNQDNENISKATYEALMNAIKIAKAGNYIGDISNEIERTANQYGYEVIRDYGGHGCGNKIHEAPLILNYGKQHTGTKLVNNMTLCIEPMLFTKNNKYYIDKKNN
jgi:methionyl aminopeptidase